MTLRGERRSCDWASSGLPPGVLEELQNDVLRREGVLLNREHPVLPVRFLVAGVRLFELKAQQLAVVLHVAIPRVRHRGGRAGRKSDQVRLDHPEQGAAISIGERHRQWAEV